MRIGQSVCTLALAAVAMVSPSPTCGESAELGYGVLAPFRSGSPVGYLGSKQLVAQPQAPKPLQAEPSYAGGVPLYIGARLG